MGTFYGGREPQETSAVGQPDFSVCVLMPDGRVDLVVLPLWATMSDLHEQIWILADAPADTLVYLICRHSEVFLPDSADVLADFDLPRFLALRLILAPPGGEVL